MRDDTGRSDSCGNHSPLGRSLGRLGDYTRSRRFGSGPPQLKPTHSVRVSGRLHPDKRVLSNDVKPAKRETMPGQSRKPTGHWSPGATGVSPVRFTNNDRTDQNQRPQSPRLCHTTSNTGCHWRSASAIHQHRSDRQDSRPQTPCSRHTTSRANNATNRAAGSSSTSQPQRPPAERYDHPHSSSVTGADSPTETRHRPETSEQNMPVRLRSVWKILFVLSAVAGGESQALAQSVPVEPAVDSEELFFTPEGFDAVGVPRTADGKDAGTLQITIRDAATGKPTPCRVNVVGPDGNYYEPAENRLTRYSLTGVWPESGWGNRQGKAPFRYLGRFFYTTGQATVRVPPGPVRVEVWKGFEYKPITASLDVPAKQTRQVELSLEEEIPTTQLGYYSGDPHIHIAREDAEDDEIIFDLMQAEEIRYGTLLGYNDPAGPYAGFMEQLDSPQYRGLGEKSIATRDGYAIISGQEYRTSTFGHLNLFLRDDIVFPGESFNADNWPVYGNVGHETIDLGGYAFYAHGGYAQEIYADFVQGAVNGVELLQFGVYRGIGLTDWYHIHNIGYRFPAVGACDFPACRKLGDCKTYVELTDDQTFPAWLEGAAAGKSFVTTGPILLLEVNGEKPGGMIHSDEDSVNATARVRVKSVVAPVTDIQLIVNGEVVEQRKVSKEDGLGEWLELEVPLEVSQSSWVAARAFSTSEGGAPDAESHTNPVYIYLGGAAPFSQESLDILVAEIDKQIARHSSRQFPEQSQVLNYFQRSRDILMKIRASGGLTSDFDPRKLAEVTARLELDGSVRMPTDAELAEFLKPVPAKPPAEALQTFETIDGFEMQLVAAEPLVVDPIAAAFDENGNLYVCEMRDYPYKPAEGGVPIGTLRFLRDTDGDGRFDESHIFADELLWAGGVAPWKGGVFVAAPPDIWYLKDTDGDHRADLRRKVYTGFGTENQQALLNNLQMGLDFKIYGSTAGNGGTITTVDDPEAAPVSVNGRDFRFDPVTGKFESITGTIQFGNTFDDWGNRFLCSESQPLHHVVLPQEYLVRNPFLSVSQVIQNIAPGPVPIYRISPVERWRHIRSSRRIASNSRLSTAAGASHHVIDAAAGVTIYRGGAYPPEFYGNVFLGDGQNNLIHRRKLVPNGVTFTSERIDEETEIVRSSDIWFRPVNFVNAPDGTLYVLDMSREVLEAIHIPLDVVKHLDLKSGRENGRIYRLAPSGFESPPPPQLGSADVNELVAALESPHSWWRETAHRLIYERQNEAAIEPLKQLLRRTDSPQTRVHALWSLAGLNALGDDDLRIGLSDPTPGVRENAVKLAENRLDESPEVLAQVLELAADEDARVRFQVAFSLGESSAARAAGTLFDMLLAGAGDYWMRTALLSSAAGAADRLIVELLDRPEFLASSTGSDLLNQLASIIGSRNQSGEVGAVLQTITTHPNTSNDGGLQQRVLRTIGAAVVRAGGTLSVDAAESPEAATLLQQSTETALAAAADDAAEEAARLSAIEFLGYLGFDSTQPVLSALLNPQQPQSVQAAAVAALARSSDPEIAELLLDEWRTYPPDVRKVVIETLLSRDAWCRTFLEMATEDPVNTVNQIAPASRTVLLSHRDEQVRKLAEQLFGGDASSSRKEVVDNYQESLQLTGAVEPGRELFVKHCSVCHKIGDTGFAIGPDLTTSQDRDPAAILTHILDPNRYVPPNYLQYVVLDNDGRTYTGMIAAQTATSITLKREKEQTDTLLRTNIDELAATGKSLMPEGLEKDINPQQMADLIAYVVSAHKPAEQPSPEDPLKTRDFGTLPGLIEPKKE
ncbi:MAG: dehydrogenase [Planctomycetota bacterium]|nr:MAG: dehydrogenase [Planctomycetota bacterium]REK36078.1 MAG: dehydrogenase [Planctomycetota bacterium]